MFSTSAPRPVSTPVLPVFAPAQVRAPLSDPMVCSTSVPGLAPLSAHAPVHEPVTLSAPKNPATARSADLPVSTLEQPPNTVERTAGEWAEIGLPPEVSEPPQYCPQNSGQPSASSHSAPAPPPSDSEPASGLFLAAAPDAPELTEEQKRREITRKRLAARKEHLAVWIRGHAEKYTKFSFHQTNIHQACFFQGNRGHADGGV